MAMPVHAIKEWLDTLDDNDLIAIEDGGLALIVVDYEACYLEVGGVPDSTYEED
jgi:hypothetical protein